jgi:hypothetical protein
MSQKTRVLKSEVILTVLRAPREQFRAESQNRFFETVNVTGCKCKDLPVIDCHGLPFLFLRWELFLFVATVITINRSLSECRFCHFMTVFHSFVHFRQNEKPKNCFLNYPVTGSNFNFFGNPFYFIPTAFTFTFVSHVT